MGAIASTATSADAQPAGAAVARTPAPTDAKPAGAAVASTAAPTDAKPAGAAVASTAAPTDAKPTGAAVASTAAPTDPKPAGAAVAGSAALTGARSIGAAIASTATSADAQPAGAAVASTPAPAGARPAAAAFVSTATPGGAKPGGVAASTATSSSGSTHRSERREKMKRMRLTVARNLKNCQDTMAMLSTFQQVDMSSAMALRKEYKDDFQEEHGIRLGFMSLFMKASANALEANPVLNAYIDSNSNEIVYRDYIDISFAAATSRGLVTPVVRNVQSLSIIGIERDYQELTGKAKKDKLAMEDIMGSTFTISNGGVFGSMLGTPLIGTTEQAAILGLHATKPRPVVLENGEIAVRPIMYLALTYDHRLVDGREAIAFLGMVRDQIEDARRVLLEI